jgi:hypothetical protein
MPNEKNAGEVLPRRNNEGEENKWMQQSKRLTKAILPIFFPISALLTAIFTGLLYQVNDKANQVSLDTQRAFISLIGPSMVPDIKDNKVQGINFLWSVNNSGSTPAINGIGRDSVATPMTEIRSGFNFDELPQGQQHRFVMGPKVTLTMDPLNVPLDTLEAVERGKHVYLWGWITYSDMFKGTPRRLTEFCYEITSVKWAGPDHTSPDTKVSGVFFPPCATHNCYDKDCEDYDKRTQ